jgi:hypothetical protein
MTEQEVALATNRSGWNKVAPLFHGGTALPDYDTSKYNPSFVVPLSAQGYFGCRWFCAHALTCSLSPSLVPKTNIVMKVRFASG